MRISTLERTLTTLARKASATRTLELLRDLARDQSALELDFASAATTLAARLDHTRPAANPEEVEKPWM
jgi:hypothetical protein